MAAGALIAALGILRGRDARGIVVNAHTLTAGQTRAHVELLARQFDFIHPDALPRALEHPGRRPFCLLTFDDGKKSNATQVAPELLRLGVPALFCVTSGFLDRGGLLWFDRWAAARRQGRGISDPAVALAVLKQLPSELLAERIERLCHGLPEAARAGEEDVAPMSWDEVRRLHREGFGIGAHGVGHAILPWETLAAARAEIQESMARVSAETGAPCVSFAFPNGNHTAQLARHAAGLGARIVLTTDPAWVRSGDPVWRLPRVQLHGAHAEWKTGLKIALAGLPGCLANPDGSGRAYYWQRRLERRRLRE